MTKRRKTVSDAVAPRRPMPATKRIRRVRPRRVTIREVAKHAGVSLTTVSRVINMIDAVRPQVRERVRAAMTDLGYVPDVNAQSLRTQATKTVGCIVPDISFPAFSSTIGAIEERLRSAGYTMQIMATQESYEREIGILSLCRGRRLAGLITSIGRDNDDAILKALCQLPFSTILLDRRIPAPIDSVCIDHFSGALQATEYLLQLGHRRIGLITLSQHALPGRERRRAFSQAHAARGIAFNPAWITGPGFESDHAYRIAYELLAHEPRPTAIMAGGFPTIGVMRAARSLGISIPQDLSLISFGDTDFADLLSPPLTVVRWDNGEVGQIAADVLLSRIEDRARDEPIQIVLPSELVIRGSCAPWCAP
jgi:LacI family transcriptional regulator